MRLRRIVQGLILGGVSAAASPVLLAADAAPSEPLQEVVVTATPLGRSTLETAQPASVLQGPALQRELASSIGETLEHQLGVSASYFGPTASRPIIRGLGGERVLMLEDSIGALDVSGFSSDHAVSVEPLLADRVEIVKGPATLMYGNGATGGIVNVLTSRIPEHRALDPLSGALELRGDTASQEKSGAARLDGGAGNWALHLDAYKRSTANVAIPGNSLSPALLRDIAAGNVDEAPNDSIGHLLGSDSRAKGGAVGASYIGERGFLGVGVSRYDTNYGAPGPETLANGGSVRIDMTQTRYDLKSQLQGPLPGIDLLRLRAAHNDYRHQEFEPDGTPGTIFRQQGDEVRLMLDPAALGAWRTTTGLQYRDIRFAAIGEEAFVPQNHTRNTGLFLFGERPLGPVKIELGARAERQTIDLTAGGAKYSATGLNASAGVLWKFTDQQSLAVNLTRTQRHPSATELFADGPHTAVGRYEIGDAGIRQESALTADVTLRRYAGPMRFELTAFASKYHDYIYAAPTLETRGEGELFPVVEYRQQDARFRGLEAELGWPALPAAGGELGLRLAMDYVTGKLTNGGGDLPQIPPLRVGAEVSYTRQRWNAEFSTYRHSAQNDVAQFERPSDAYSIVDFSVGYRLETAMGQWQLFAKGSNLGNVDARRHTSPLKDYAPLPGRSVSFGARVEF